MTNLDSPPGPVEAFPLNEPPHEPEPPEQRPITAPPRPAVPNDLAAEKYVIGAALLDPNQLTTCSRLLTASDFYNPAHETIWRTLTHLAALDQPTEIPAVVAHLLDTDHQGFQRFGGAPYVFSLLEACSLPASAPYYATRVEELSRHRSAIAVAERAVQQLRQPGADVDTVLNTVATNWIDARDALANPPASTTWAPVDLEPVLRGEFLDPPPTMLLRTDGVALFYDRSVHTISGESESGKTWLTLIAALQLIQNQQRVVFLDFEDRADRVIGRLMGLGATRDQIRDHFAYIRPDRPLDDDGRTHLAPQLVGVPLVIIDGVTEVMTLHGYDLNSNADAALFYGLLPRWIADQGPAVVMIDHVVKNADQQGRFAIGAQHKLAGIDGAAYTVKMIQPFGRGKRGLARVDVSKDRPGHVRGNAHGKVIAEFTLDASGDALILVAHLMPPGGGNGTGEDGTTFEPTGIMEKVSRYVEANPGVARTVLENVINGRAKTIRTAVELLVTRNYIGTKVAPRGRIEHFSMKPYREDDTDTTDPHEPSDPWLNKPETQEAS